MRLGDALAQASIYLASHDIESPQLDAELLLAYLLDTNRAAILARPEQQLTSEQLTRYRSLVARRGSREPLAYILGYWEFYGLEFMVDPRVLIPRPETELLVEHALRIASQMSASPHIADVGAGSGAIAISLAVHLPESTIHALDNSPGALEVVTENARLHSVAGRVHCLHSDLLAALPVPVDIITANLPYVTTDEWQELAPEIRNHEPRSALHGGPDGLALIERLLTTAEPNLRPGGSILLEIGAGQGVGATSLAHKNLPHSRVQLVQDYAGLDRLVIIETETPNEI